MKKITYFLICVLSLSLSCTKEDVSSNDNSSGNGNGNGSIDTSANQQATGTSANALLSDTEFNQLIIELAYVEGFSPSNTAVDNLIAFLTERTFKPNGISVVTQVIPSQENIELTVNDIIAIEDNYRTQYNSEGTITVWAFFTNGSSANNTENGVVLGTAYRNTSFVIFEETIHGLSDGTFEPNRSVLESTVILHEIGHLLGLTNLGTALQSDHEDQDHPKHCNVETCLMYFSAETGSGIENLIGANSAPELDAQCIADLQANGGK